MNLLHDALVPCRTPGSPSRAHYTLPQVFAAWSQGDELDIEGIRAHQQPAVEAALAQLAAHALEVAGQPLRAHSADEWVELLQQLANRQGASSFWELCVEDPARAAFMQPALDTGVSLDHEVSSLGELETLVLSKNHDVKQDDMAHATPWHWACALMTLQTTGGYAGRGLYGVMRMNTGTGTRVFVGSYETDTQTGRWRCDVARLGHHWHKVLEQGALGFRPDGWRLLAAVPWNGQTQLGLDALHPGVVEVCRIVRLRPGADNRLRAQRASTLAARLGGTAALRGVCGDPWTPLATDEKGLKALTPGETGFTWSHFLNLVTADFAHQSPFALDASTGREMTLKLRALCRGKSQTNGYREFSFTFPRKLARTLFSPQAAPDERDAMLARSKAASEWAQKQAWRVGKAYCISQCPVETTPDEVDEVVKSKHHKKVVDALKQTVTVAHQQSLLPWLTETLELDNASAMNLWQQRVHGINRQALLQCLAPRPNVLRAGVLSVAKGLHALG